MEPEERGDPVPPLRWTAKSTRALARELTCQGHGVSADTAGDLLREEGFSLQGNAKTIEGRRHPDRDAQFRYLNEQVKAHQDAGEPVVSVDARTKELAGEFKNGGREWRPKGGPAQVSTHDFPDRELGKAIPYGVCDLAANAGWVNAGTGHDTATFAVESIRRWWNVAGRGDYPRARRLLITADAGGSNGYRTRAWKTELAALAAQTGLEITVCQFPHLQVEQVCMAWPAARAGGLRPMWGRPKIAGFAVTVELEPLNAEHAGAHILTDAIAGAGAENVMVVANGGRIDVSSWGGIVSVGAAMRSIRGVVTDGACRDVDQARDLGFPVFARAQVPVTARGRLQQKSAGAPVPLGQVIVNPGDVVADEGGVVVIPRERAAEVLAAARGVRAGEEQIENEVRAGVPLPQVMRDARLAGTEAQ